MSQAVMSTAETPVFFEAGGDTLFGILTEPAAEPLGIAVVVVPTGGVPLAAGRNRWQVHLCRLLAAEGFHAFRFDYHGAGESTGTIPEWKLENPFVDDVQGAARFLESQGIDRVFIVAACFGTRSTLWAARGIPGLEGIAFALVQSRDFEREDTVPLRLAESKSLGWYVKRALRPAVFSGLRDKRRRDIYKRVVRMKVRSVRKAAPEESSLRGISPHFLAPLDGILKRKIPVTFIFGTEDNDYADFLEGRNGRLGEVLDAAGDLVTVHTIDPTIQAFSTVHAQNEVVAYLHAHLTERYAGNRAPAS
jgi:pimeloyl-ACP methyl ester carboxylesterase